MSSAEEHTVSYFSSVLASQIWGSTTTVEVSSHLLKTVEHYLVCWSFEVNELHNID